MSWSTLPLAAVVLAATSALAFPTTLSNRATAAQAATDLCGDNDSIILSRTPWIVFNMLYNADEIVGSQCTGYVGQKTASDGTAEVLWNSTTAIEYVKSTDNVPKGYSFVGLTQNLETTISSIGSIPATYDWTRTNTTAFKGNVCFDFMTNDVKGDSTSDTSHELMLWLEYEGGQLPIGWGKGAVATIDDLFGTSWKLYQDINTDTGILVSSLLPEKQFDGSFKGDLKDWLQAMASQGLFTDSTYVNVGNAGTEFFYGDAFMSSTLALQIDLGSTSAGSAKVITTSSAPSTKSSASTVAHTTTSVGKTSSIVSTPTPVVVSSLVHSSSTVISSVPTTTSTRSAAKPKYTKTAIKWPSWAGWKST